MRGAVLCCSQHGSTAMMQAAAQGETETVRVLLEAGADPNAQSTNGLTALMLSASKPSAEVVALLLAKGANLNIRNEVGGAVTLPLRRAVVHLLLLLLHGAQIGYTALIIALEQDRKAIAKTLVEAGADVNCSNKVSCRHAARVASPVPHPVSRRVTALRVWVSRRERPPRRSRSGRGTLACCKPWA